MLQQFLARSRYLVVIAVIGSFLGFVVTWNGSINIVALGIAVGLVLFALGYLLGLGFKAHSTKGTETTNEE